ncbi:MAG: glycogen synthase GlgA [Bradymonadales bacterium]|nr:glycogen synthase GlgA [Bradymonadales bacterium]
MALDILFVTSEVSPYSTTGGLSEVMAALPRALRMLGHRVTVLSPFYRLTGERTGPLSRPVRDLHFRLGSRDWTATALGCTGHDQVRHFFLDIPELYDRPGVYGNGEGYPDNPLRYAVLSRAATALVCTYDIPVDIIHSHDWQGALAPYFLKSCADNRHLAGQIGTVLTIHNLAFQGSTSPDQAEALGLTNGDRLSRHFELGGSLNLMKGGILSADLVTTVSPTYASEICSPERGAGLHEVLLFRREALSGILNGVDYSIWSPEKDIHLPANYDLRNLNGKRRCKAALQARFNLERKPWIPLLGVVSRLAEQKGTDLLLEAVVDLLDDELIQLVLLGEGNEDLEAACHRLQQRYPRRVAVEIGYLAPLAHQIFAGADLFAMPSRFEPCGLSQMYAMRYGAIPVVRDTGGLHDTVKAFQRETLQGTGFVFNRGERTDLLQTLRQAVDLYLTDRRSWRALTENAMQADFSWNRAAKEYTRLYLEAKEAAGGPAPLQA